MQKLIDFFLTFAIFFPYIGFVNNIDIQPNFFFLGIIFLFVALIISRIKVNANVFYVYIIIFLFIIIRFSLELELLDYKYISTYIIAITTPFLLHIVLHNNLIYISEKKLTFILLIYILVGIIQLIHPMFLTGLVSRSEDAIMMLVSSGRGVRSLTAEPARFGEILLILNILFVYLIMNRESDDGKIKHSIIITIILLLCNILISQSSYSVFLHTISTIVLFIVLKKFYIIALLSAPLMLIIPTLLSGDNYRIYIIFHSLLSDTDYLLQQGAFMRLMNVPISLNNLTYYGIFGSGNSNSEYYSSIYTFIGNYHYIVSNRNHGGVIEYLLKFGVLSFPIFIIYIYIMKNILKLNYKLGNKHIRMGIFFCISLLIVSLQDGSPANPLMWFSLIFIFINSNY